MTSSGYLQTRMAAAFVGCLAAVARSAPASPSPKSLRARLRSRLPPRRGAHSRGTATHARMGGCPAGCARSSASRPEHPLLRGGIDGIGVTSGTPRVYLVFLRQPVGPGAGIPRRGHVPAEPVSRDPAPAARCVGHMTQYCDGPPCRRATNDLQPRAARRTWLPRQRRPGGSVVSTRRPRRPPMRPPRN